MWTKRTHQTVCAAEAMWGQWFWCARWIVVCKVAIAICRCELRHGRVFLLLPKRWTAGTALHQHNHTGTIPDGRAWDFSCWVKGQRDIFIDGHFFSFSLFTVRRSGLWNEKTSKHKHFRCMLFVFSMVRKNGSIGNRRGETTSVLFSRIGTAVSPKLCYITTIYASRNYMVAVASRDIAGL